MSESNIEPEAQPSTSKTDDTKKTAAVIPLVSMPKVVLTRLDLNNLPVPENKSPSSPAKKPIKKLTEKNNDSAASKKVSVKTPTNNEQERSKRGRPRKDYKKLANLGSFDDEEIKTTTPSGKVSGTPKKAAKSTYIEEDYSVKGMLKKTMLQKRSKIAIPPPKKAKLMSSKENLSSPKLKKDLTKAVTPKTINKDVSSILKNTISQMDTDVSEDEFLYDELIDELVNPPNKKPLVIEKTTNITLKPNVGNKPPTIVKGGIVKKSSLPPDLKSVSSPTTLNSSKLTGSLSNSKFKTTSENTIKSPATAETPKASLPTKASPFPISLSSSPTKIDSKGKKGPNKSSNEITVKDTQPLHLNTPASTSAKNTQKPVTPAPRPKGRPRLGPKQPVMTSSFVSTVADDESDEYTEIETLEPDPEPLELLPNKTHKSNDVQAVTQDSSNASNDLSVDRPETDTTKDTDPHLDLLRILTGDIEETSVDSMVSKGKSENPHDSSSEDAKKTNTSSPERIINDTNTNNPEKEDNSFASLQTGDIIKEPVHDEEKNSKINNVSEPSVKTVIEEIPPVRTVYDLMNDVSLKYPSWNLHIIPETNAFCIAQVTKGRLGLPTLKKCIELDAETYSAKVYIHQYHIKRFDGVYDSEEAILALIEEIHSIKA